MGVFVNVTPETINSCCRSMGTSIIWGGQRISGGGTRGHVCLQTVSSLMFDDVLVAENIQNKQIYWDIVKTRNTMWCNKYVTCSAAINSLLNHSIDWMKRNDATIARNFFKYKQKRINYWKSRNCCVLMLLKISNEILLNSLAYGTSK